MGGGAPPRPIAPARMGTPPSEAPQDDRVVRIRQHGGFSNLPDVVYRHACACCRKELACRPATCERSELPLQAGTAGKAHQKGVNHRCTPFCGIAPHKQVCTGADLFEVLRLKI